MEKEDDVDKTKNQINCCSAKHLPFLFDTNFPPVVYLLAPGTHSKYKEKENKMWIFSSWMEHKQQLPSFSLPFLSLLKFFLTHKMHI